MIATLIMCVSHAEALLVADEVDDAAMRANINPGAAP
jgi:hypothetical protein